ncbi:testis-specific gene A8 protein-like [Panicum virgatum]|uniref:testis-specific gene A8 protein-like n=1 Tax=Panicum virgatum TaxID=38727 RepID=UPI0019D50F02|nr:testis-specific gene A8 protein-like [Panicum virgatum]
MAPNAAATDALVPGAATPDAVAPEAPAMAAVAPTPGLAMASTAAAGAATASTSVPEVPTSVPDIPSPSSQPAAKEELEVVSGRRLLQDPTEEDAIPLPRVLVRVRLTIEEATSTTEAAFRREWAALESERQRLGD